MPAQYPAAIYTPRAVENRVGVVYDATKLKVNYAEDKLKPDEEIVAIQTELGLSPKGLYASVLERLTNSIKIVSKELLVFAMNFNVETVIGSAGSETVLDSSDQNNHGVNSGATHLPVGGFNGGGCFDFDGVNDFISIPDSDSLDPTALFSLVFWINLDALASEKGAILFPVEKHTSGDIGWYTWLQNTNDKLYIRLGSDSLYTALAIPKNQWVHVAFSWNGTVGTWYVNGAYSNSANMTSYTPSGEVLAIGAGNVATTPSGFIDGKIDDVRLYARALTADEVKSLYLQQEEIVDSFVNKKNAYINNATILSSNYAVDSQASDTYIIALSPKPLALSVGMAIVFKANTANTGAATLNVNGLGAKAIVKGVSTALSNNDILAGMLCHVVYDGTSFVILNPRVL